MSEGLIKLEPDFDPRGHQALTTAGLLMVVERRSALLKEVGAGQNQTLGVSQEVVGEGRSLRGEIQLVIRLDPIDDITSSSREAVGEEHVIRVPLLGDRLLGRRLTPQQQEVMGQELNKLAERTRERRLVRR
jgi:hypothetical protein